MPSLLSPSGNPSLYKNLPTFIYLCFSASISSYRKKFPSMS
jgi:hypothetical protein